jgi:phage portal protein BeeE
MTQENAPKSAASQVIKFDLPTLMATPDKAGLNGEFMWPIHPLSLFMLYRSSPEHGRAINIKAHSAFGGGLTGDGKEQIESLCEFGAANLFVNLGLDLETYGNAFVQTIRNSKGEVVELRRLPAITMTRFRKGYLQRTWNAQGGEKKTHFSKDEVRMLKVPCPSGRIYSFPEWIGTEGMLELAHAATRYNARFFQSNAMPEYAVMFKDKNVDQATKDAIAGFFRNEFQGVDNSHRTLLLTVGGDQEEKLEDRIKIQKLTEDIKDADFLKLLDAARDRIPIAHGVPPRMLGIVTSGSLGGSGEVSGQLFTFEHLTLKPKRQLVLDQLRPLFREFGLRPGRYDKGLAKDEIDFEPLDLTPPKDDTEELPDLVSAGILTPEEAKALHPNLKHRIGALEKSAEGASSSQAPKTLGDQLVALLGKL